MKVGIFTFSEGNNNAGALLQAYALQEAIRSLGHEPEMIRYPANQGRWHRRVLLSRMKQQGHRRELAESYWRYSRFRRKWLKRSPPCADGRALYNIARRYEALVTGSDQVWNTQMGARAFQKRPDYGFLSFAEGLPLRRIAYAACSGVPTSDVESLVYVPYWLNQFSAISVRNRATQQLCGEWLGGREVPMACDPTYLFDFSSFRSMKPRGLPDRYILVYAFSSPAESLGQALLRRMRKEINLPVVVIPPADFMVYDFADGDLYWRSAGPCEWVGILSGAAAFLTNSFHGMAIASRMEIPFAAYYLQESHIAYRLDDIAERYGLWHHVARNDDEVATVSWHDNDMALQSRRTAIQQHVVESLAFLENALKG